MSLYDDLGALYAHKLTEHGVQVAMLTHKWQRTDLLASHSDLDVRILLDESPADWYEWNRLLAAAHASAVMHDVANRRLLEHPPGFAFTVSEVNRRRVSPPELATWSLVHGHLPILQRWKSHAQMVPWSRLDERFYRGILDSRLGGRYQLAADSTDNVTQDILGYRRHCVAWHYLAPCWFAAAALATRTRCPGKSAALTQWHPAGLEQYAEMFLHHAVAAADGARQPPSIRNLLRSAHVALDAAMKHVPTPADSRGFEEAEGSQAMAWTMTAGMLRVRVARWLYYLDPPPGVATGYLIAREAKELRAAVEILRSLAADGTTPEQQLASHMADLLPTGPTTPAVLRGALAAWEQHHALVEDFLSLHAT
ncbi:hypothetical protein ACFXJ5_09445 [Streptomyces sp. NPDC059373]